MRVLPILGAAIVLAAFLLAFTVRIAAGSTVTTAICRTFGPYCGQAIRVARCESHLNVWATNGEYVNIFQMGAAERRRYGWHVAGSSPWIASRAAYNYFRASGYSWRRWTCGWAA